MMCLRIDLANLEPVEHALLSTYIRIITDPAMSHHRRRMLDGELALAIEAEDVSWINPCELVQVGRTEADTEEVVP